MGALCRAPEEPTTWFPGVSSMVARRPAVQIRSEDESSLPSSPSPVRGGPGAAAGSSAGSGSRRLARQDIVNYEEPRKEMRVSPVKTVLLVNRGGSGGGGARPPPSPPTRYPPLLVSYRRMINT